MEVHAVRSWVDTKQGGVVVVEDDVQNVVRDIREIDSRLHVYYNQQTEGFDVVETCLDGTDRLVTSAQTLDQRLVSRVREADHWRGQDRPAHILSDDEDFAARIDRDNETIEAERRQEFRDRLAYAGEGLAWSLDIARNRSSVGGSILVPRSINGAANKG